jgi:type II protein arginine methyltransferase
LTYFNTSDAEDAMAPTTDVRAADPWEGWNNLRMATESNPRVSVALEITEDLPDTESLNRWLAEPVKAVFVPTSVFIANKKGYPVLSSGHQDFLQKLFRV